MIPIQIFKMPISLHFGFISDNFITSIFNSIHTAGVLFLSQLPCIFSASFNHFLFSLAPYFVVIFCFLLTIYSIFYPHFCSNHSVILLAFFPQLGLSQFILPSSFLIIFSVGVTLHISITLSNVIVLILYSHFCSVIFLHVHLPFILLGDESF